MYGVAYWLRKSRMTQSELAERAHITVPTLRRMEEDTAQAMTATHYVKLAAALDISELDLIRCYDESALEDGDHPTHRSRRPPIGNCLDVYCAAHNLRYRQMAERLGLGSRQAAQQACTAEKPCMRHISTLARLEGITTAEFMLRYAPDGRAAV